MKKITFIIICLLIFNLSNAQVRTITGRVTSSDDDLPLPGVTVVAEGTTIGTVTNADGVYEIQPPADSKSLKFTFIGKKTQTIDINGQTSINVQLEDEAVGVDEVVVVGFGQQVKSDITGSIAKIKVESLQKVPAPSFESSLQGKTPGVFIEKSSGKLGEGIKIRVRGTSSLSASNQPLYVVDGMIITTEDQGTTTNNPTNPIADLNFDDIESVQILKDASAAAIYGSRGSNGVVIITTKTGKANQPSRININYSRSYSEPTIVTDFLNTEEYVELIGESMENAQWADPGNGKSEILSWAGYENIDDAPNTNWNDYAFRDAVSSNINLSSQGGNETSQYYFGFSYDDQESILIGNDYERFSGRLNLNHKVSEKVELGAKFNFVKSDLYRVSNDNAFATPMQLIAQAPFFPAYVDDEPYDGTFYYNGLISHKYDRNDTRSYRTFANAFAKIELVKDLTFHSLFGVDNLNQREDQYRSRKTNDGSPAGKSYLRNSNVFNWTFDNYLNYIKNFNEVHKLEIVAGNSLQKSEQFISRTGGKTFPSDEFQTIASAAENDDFFSFATSYSYLSFFSRANYKYAGKYLLSASYRIDGSSKFGADNKYGNFYSASAGWLISEESFMLNQEIVSYLKLRASYGLTGNSEIGNFGSLGLFDGSSYAGKPAIRPSQLANPDLSWETTAQTDIGLDFGFFKNRINGEIDFYYKKTSDLLLNRLLPYTTGFASITENVGELENKGMEFSINSNNLTGNFKWNTSLNLATNSNKVLNIVSPMTFGRNRVEEGQPVGVLYMKKYAGVNPDNGDALYYVEEGSEETTNNYSKAADMVVGDPNPDWYGGLENFFSYKGVDLKIFFQFVYGNDMYNEAGRFMSANGDWVDNQTKDQMNRWQNPGDITDVPQARFGESNGTRPSSRWIYDGSYLRLKDLTLGYNLPKRLISKAGLSKVRIYASGINIMTWTNFPLYDPEVNSAGTDRSQTSSNIQQGIWYYSTPQAKSYTFGINITF
ncbi:MAG: TonB-dependent receptor [Prolixibacteraceae bacterium]|nr:TonB-dependent receptor [Prolixibacteraceae bacterium]